MRKVLLVLLGAAVVLALGIGPLVTTASARHIEAQTLRGAADDVAAFAASGDKAKLQAAVAALVGSVAGPPEGVPPGHASPPEGVPPGNAGPPEGVPPGHAGPPAGVPPGPPEGVPADPDDDEDDEDDDDVE